MLVNRRLSIVSAALLLAMHGAMPSRAQSPAGYFAGKQVKMIIGLGTGGGYDLWARMVARHIGRHLPGNPNVIAQNMEGAGSFRAASYMYAQAPKDGTVMALIARDASLGPITGNPGAQFDPTKFSWLGTTATETNVCIAHKNATVKTVQDLLTKELTVGDNGAGTGTGNYPKALNQLLGLKFRIVRGYVSSADVVLAMERGEVDGYCESLESVYSKRPDWIPSKTVNVLFQGGVRPNPEIKDVPFINDLAKTEDDRRAIEVL
jgi:tripartite-type tricarboxylate transporter receptor subunit TctC